MEWSYSSDEPFVFRHGEQLALALITQTVKRSLHQSQFEPFWAVASQALRFNLSKIFTDTHTGLQKVRFES